MADTDHNLSPPKAKGFAALAKKVSETTFYRKTLVYRPALLRGGLGIAIGALIYHHAHPDDKEGALIEGLIAWRLFIDSSLGQAKEDAKKVL